MELGFGRASLKVKEVFCKHNWFKAGDGSSISFGMTGGVW